MNSDIIIDSLYEKIKRLLGRFQRNSCTTNHDRADQYKSTDWESFTWSSSTSLRLKNYFVNFIIFVPQTGQTALNVALPLEVVSLLTSVSFTVTFFLHFTQNISTMQHCLGFSKANPTGIIAFPKLCETEILPIAVILTKSEPSTDIRCEGWKQKLMCTVFAKC